MNIQIILLTFLVAFSSISYSDDSKTIVLMTEEFENFTQRDGKGMYWDIFRTIYEKKGYKVVTKNSPYARSASLLKKKTIDAIPGVYADEFDYAYFPAKDLYFDIDKVAALFKKDSVKSWNGQKTIEGKRVGWIRSYEYHEYLDVKVDYRESTTRKAAIKMLLKGRLDFFLDPQYELKMALDNGFADSKVFSFKNVMNLHLYPAFRKDKKGKKLLDIYSEGLKELKNSGKLKALYGKYDEGYHW